MSSNATAGDVNGVSGHVNGDTPKPLKIAIVGAGIGGLTAAIGLRRNGHEVTLYEQSRFANEVGAAIHLAPNSNGILRRYGLHAEDFGGVAMQKLAEYSGNGAPLRNIDLTEPNKMWQHPWQLVHRVRLHDKLKEMATSAKGVGPAAVLKTSSKIVEVDPEAAIVVLESGEKIQADVILGADGIYSVTRSAVSGHPSKLFGSGKAAFRFLIPRKAALANPLTAKLADNHDELYIWFGEDRRVVMYPCDSNELLNFVCIHPDTESQGSAEGWNKDASLDQMLKVYKNFDPVVLAFFSLADPATLKVWKLLDMDTLPTWIKGRLALLGDAAHPFLPHQGQGGGIAMEDAATLAVVLGADVTSEEVPERLKLYETIRYNRAHQIQEFSRQAGQDAIDGKPQIDMMHYTAVNFGHDEFDNSTKELRKWKAARNPSVRHRMPLAFGPAPGPRQGPDLKRRAALHSTFVTASMKFKTSRTFLQNLFPNDSYSFKSPATVAYASFSVTTLDKMDWLGGGGYNHFGLYIHGVQYKKKDGTTIDGTYMPVLFESLSDPILTGREELGMPKVYCAIDIDRDDNHYHMKASWRGAEFCDFKLDDLATQDPKTEAGTIGGESDYGILVYRYIPAVGEPGKADAEYSVVVPHGEDAKVIPSTVHKVLKCSKPSVTFDKKDWTALPTIHHIADVLADIPIYEIVGAKIVEGSGVPDVGAARRIE